jgi:Ca2+:H+ antiporter
LDEEEEVRSVRSHDEDPIMLKARRSLINVKQPIGLPIWKPTLYQKSRMVTRKAEEALRSIPSAQAEKHLQ